MTADKERINEIFGAPEISEAVSFGSQGWLYRHDEGHSQTVLSWLGMLEEDGRFEMSRTSGYMAIERIKATRRDRPDLIRAAGEKATKEDLRVLPGES